MRNLAHEAGFLALDQLEERGPNVVVLMPPGWGAIAFDMGPWPEGIWPRFSDKHTELRSLPIHCLIVVGRDHDIEGFEIMREKLRGQLHPRLFVIHGGDRARSDFEGHDCFGNPAVQAVRDLSGSVFLSGGDDEDL